MSSIIPLDEIKTFVHDEVSENDMKDLCWRLVRREVVLKYLDILETNDEDKIEELDDEVSAFPLTFSLSCKEANIKLNEDLIFEMVVQLRMLVDGIREFGNDGIMKRLAKLVCQMSFEDDTLWIEMGKSFMTHDTIRGVQVLREKTFRIVELQNACEELISSGELNDAQLNTLRIKRNELLDSFRFFTVV